MRKKLLRIDGMTASDFIRSRPPEMSVDDVMAEGHKLGFGFSRQLVHTVRSTSGLTKRKLALAKKKSGGKVTRQAAHVARASKVESLEELEERLESELEAVRKVIALRKGKP